MSLEIRRVVTGHDASGKAVVKIDEIARNIKNNRPGASSCVVWSTDGFPVDNGGEVDPSAASIGTTIESGTVFRVVRYEPGVSPRNHRINFADVATHETLQHLRAPCSFREHYPSQNSEAKH